MGGKAGILFQGRGQRKKSSVLASYLNLVEDIANYFIKFKMWWYLVRYMYSVAVSQAMERLRTHVLTTLFTQIIYHWDSYKLQ